MVTTIYNITRDMQTISCYVDNGYGTPMQVKIYNIQGVQYGWDRF